MFEGMSRIDDSLMGNIRNNAGKRQIGKGFVGFLTDAEYRQSRLDANVRQQMVELHDHRWVVCSVCNNINDVAVEFKVLDTFRTHYTVFNIQNHVLVVWYKY